MKLLDVVQSIITQNKVSQKEIIGVIEYLIGDTVCVDTKTLFAISKIVDKAAGYEKAIQHVGVGGDMTSRTKELNTLLDRIRYLAAECDCRAEHGADGAEHLKAIGKWLFEALDKFYVDDINAKGT